MVVDVKVTSCDDMAKAFKEKGDTYRTWTVQETREKKVWKAVMVPLIISHDGAVHKESVKRWKDIAPDIQVDWVRMSQNVLRYNVVIVGKFFNKGSWISEAWRKEHSDEFAGEPEGQHERIPTREERMDMLNHDNDPESAVCVRSSGTPPPHGVRLTSVERGNPNPRESLTNQST